MSAHYSEDDLTLYYYGEGRRRAAIEEHLQTCDACASLYREISSTLALVVADAVPERGDQYGLEVWQRLRHRLPESEAFDGGPFGWLSRMADAVIPRNQLAWAAAAAVLVVAAFVAGRAWRPTAPASNVPNVATNAPHTTPSTANGAASTADADARRRILITSVADHLDQSERVLADIMNAPEAGDISFEQRWAEDLVTASRLYRQDAIDAGERSVANVLDDLERNLLEIVHSPSKISAADLEQIRRRIDAAALLFKVRVMSDELRQREAAPSDRPNPRPSNSSIS
ncbi:MAG TPA: hypothetical protein VH583_19745 [Vicinamibacterales bacterium]